MILNKPGKSMVLRPTGAHSVAAEFTQVYQQVFKEVKLPDRMDPRRILNLRPSQLPYCPVNMFVQVGQNGRNRTLDMAGGYYTRVGTTVHEVMQKYLGTSRRFLADWQCPVCKKWRRKTHEPYCCGVLSRYEELLIDYKGVVGHIDGVYKDRSGRYWILDFKTTSSFAAPKKKNDPGRVYIEQIEAYALFLKLQYGITVAGVMLVFIKRDNPMIPVVYARELNLTDLKAVHKRFKTYRKAHKAFLEASTLADVKALLTDFGKCKNPDCETCKLGTAGTKLALKSAYAKAKEGKRLPLGKWAEAELAKDEKKRSSKASA